MARRQQAAPPGEKAGPAGKPLRESPRKSRPKSPLKPSEERWFENRVCEGARICQMPRNSVLCAVSGGADSTTLAVALARRAAPLGIGMAIAHVDHQLRPTSGADGVIVRNLAALLGVPFFQARVEVSAKGAGKEAAARAVRYLALEQIAIREGFQIVATGHTRTDQAETVLLRLLRGAGLRGLSGMASSRRLASRLAATPGLGSATRLCRPLLSLSRDETRSYVASLGLRVAVDESNSDRAILRNALRMDLWPALAGFEPALEPHLAELARQCREDEEVLESLARAASASLTRAAAGRLVVKAPALAVLPRAVAIRLVRRAIARLRPAAQPSALHLRRIVELCVRGGAGELHIAGDLIARLRKGTLTLAPRG
jgi:tRNA(Ile)-lysidine synthase